MKNKLSQIWCKKMHSQPMWPIHGKYICPQCLREYPVTWEGPARASEYAPSLRKSSLPVATASFSGPISQTPVSTTL